MQQRIIKSIAVIFAGQTLPAGAADPAEALIQRQGARIGEILRHGAAIPGFRLGQVAGALQRQPHRVLRGWEAALVFGPLAAVLGLGLWLPGPLLRSLALAAAILEGRP